MMRQNSAEILRLAALILQQQAQQIDTSTDARTLADLILKIDPEDRPMVDWQNIADHLEPEHAAAISSSVADLSVRYARFSSYVNDRYLGHSHLHAVFAQNRIAKALRKAFGFSYPQDDITF